jgi:hypothetical protein
MRALALTALLASLATAACNGTTGDELITFPAYAAGAQGASEPFYVPSSGKGESFIPAFTIQLTTAQMYVGAIYVNEAPPGSGATFNTPACIDTGIYCAQVPGGLEVDLLSTTPQPFAPIQGNGSADLGLSWQLYLTDGDVNNTDNSGFGVPNTVDLVGTATREPDGAVFDWAASVTINQANRGLNSSQPGQPGQDPICMQRIVNIGGIALQLFQGASMLLTIDPRAWFVVPIDFSSLPPATSQNCMPDQSAPPNNAAYCIPDSNNLGGVPGSQQGVTLFQGIHSGGPAAYRLTYSTSP